MVSFATDGRSKDTEAKDPRDSWAICLSFLDDMGKDLFIVTTTLLSISVVGLKININIV